MDQVGKVVYELKEVLREDFAHSDARYNVLLRTIEEEKINLDKAYKELIKSLQSLETICHFELACTKLQKERLLDEIVGRDHYDAATSPRRSDERLISASSDTTQ